MTRIGTCRGEVTFHTEEGDCLNLKSLFSTYVFSMLADHPDLVEQGWLVCEEPEDAPRLEPFVQQMEAL